MQTHKSMSRIGLAPLLVLAALAVLLWTALPVQAAAGPVFTVRQTFNVTGEAPAGLDEAVTYRLAAEDGAPLPGGQTGSVTFTLTEDQAHTFALNVNGGAADDSAIAFAHAGVYTYTVTPTTKAPNNCYTLDTQTYTVRIYVANTENGLQIASVIAVDPDGAKADEVVYHHSYKGTAPKTPAQTVTKTATRVKTGDATHYIGWVVLIGAAAAALIAAGVSHRKNRRHHTE